MGFFSTLYGLLAKPLQTLPLLEKREPALRMELAAGFMVMVAFLGSAGLGLALVATAQLLPDPTFRAAGTLSGLLVFSPHLFFSVVGVFLGALYYHLWLTLFGAKEFRKTFVAYSYAHAPAVFQFLLVVPESGGVILYLVFTLWSLLLFAHSIRIFHGFPMRSAGVVIAMGFVVNIVLLPTVSIAGFRMAALLFPHLHPSALIPIPTA